MKKTWKAVVALVTFMVLAAGSALAACDSPVMPVIEGASWTYRDADASVSYTQRISNVTPTGFTMTQLIDGEEYAVSWACTPDGLLATEFSVPVEGFAFETLEASGVTFPNRLSVGDSWDSTFTIAGSMAQEGMQMSFSGQSVSTQTVVRRESVTVPAGTWDALVLDGPFTMTMSASVMGMTMPIPPMEGSSTVWLVEGVGMVRTESAGSVTELVEFTLP
jgi:hypothetical protein